MHSGKFISFEGSEGCGKSTQIERLTKRLENLEIDVIHTREPGGTDLGESIRHLLQHAPEGENMTPESELLLFASSRAQLVREVIAPAIKKGKYEDTNQIIKLNYARNNNALIEDDSWSWEELSRIKP